MSNLKPYLKLHFIIFIWGFTAVLGALIQLNYLVLTWYRMGLASLFLLTFLMFQKSKRKNLFQSTFKKQARYILGGVIIALHWLAFFYAIKVSNVSITLLTMSSGAFFTSLLEPIFYKRKILFYEILFGLLILFGFTVLLHIEKIEFTGVYFALIAAFLSGLFSVINGIYVQYENALKLSFFELFYGFLFLTIAMLLSGDMQHLPLPTLTDWLFILLLASICTAYAFTVSIDIMRFLSPFTVMLSINLEPVYGIILAVLVLKDKELMSSNFYFGAFIILIIIALNSFVKNYHKRD